MVGATGSANSTTLAALLDLRNATKSGHILTLEDPVEFIFTNKKGIVNQREVGTDTLDFRVALPPVRNVKGGRSAAVEVLLNTRYTAELIDKGEISEIKDAMEKSLTPGSQTFEQSLFKMYKDGLISKEEALGNADSATNLMWLKNQSEIGRAHV